MTGIDSWSTSPATNATADGGSVNWAEGQAPSTVNNTARQQAADVRSAFNDLAWFQYGTGDQGSGNLAVPSVYASATSFTITGADVTTKYEAGRRVRAVGSSTGTIYGTISSSSYNGGNTTTTVNMTWDSGSLSNETLVISLSQFPVTGGPVGSAVIMGTKTNDSASAGRIGEELEGNIASGSAVALTTLTYANLTSVTLTAGDWDVYFGVQFIGGATTNVDGYLISTSLVSVTPDQTVGRYRSNSYGPSGLVPFGTDVGQIGASVGPIRFSVAFNTAVFGVVYAGFTVSTCSAFGIIRARRAR